MISIEFESIRESDIQLSTIGLRRRVQTQDKARIFEKIASTIRFFHNRCPYCYITSQSDENHLLYNCPENEAQPFKVLYREYRNGLRNIKKISNFTACTRCFAPLCLCKHWEQRPNDAKWIQTSEDCSYSDVILSIFVIGIYWEYESSMAADSYRQDLQKRGFSIDRGLDELGYLSESEDWGEVKSIRLLEVFWTAAKEIVKERYIDLEREELV